MKNLIREWLWVVVFIIMSFGVWKVGDILFTRTDITNTQLKIDKVDFCSGRGCLYFATLTTNNEPVVLRSTELLAAGQVVYLSTWKRAWTDRVFSETRYEPLVVAN